MVSPRAPMNAIHGRAGLFLFLAGPWLVCPIPNASALQAPDKISDNAIADWPRVVPAEAHFYAELHDLAGLRLLFRNAGIWPLVRELSETAPAGATTRPWQRSAEEILRMDADAAIDRVLGRRAALIASESSEWQNGVLLAELESTDAARALLDQWQARKLESEGPVQRYTLAGGLMLAILDRTLALGPPGDPEGLWGRMVLLLSGRRGPSLAGRAEFAALRSRLPGSYQGLLYVAWPEGEPTAIGGCSRLLAGLSIAGSRIICELRGQRTARAANEASVDGAWAGALPASTIAVICDSYDFASLGKVGRDDSGPQSIIALLISAFSGIEGRRGLIEKLGPAYTIAIGSSEPSEKTPADFPAVAAIVPSAAPEACVQQMDSVLGFLAQFLEVANTPAGREMREVPVEKQTCEETEIHRVEFGSALSRRVGLKMLEQVNMAWCAFDKHLILSTSASQVRQIILAARHKGPRLDAEPTVRELLPRKEEAAALGQWVYLRANLASRQLEEWLKTLERERPEMLSDDWWKTWASQRLERFTRLGIVLDPDKTSPVRAIVREIEGDSPAESFLQPGDVVIAAAGRALTTTRPAYEVAERYRARGNARRFAVRVLRAGEILDLDIPIQPASPVDLRQFDPVRAARQLIALTRGVEFVTIRRDVGKADRLDARVEIQWKRAR